MPTTFDVTDAVRWADEATDAIDYSATWRDELAVIHAGTGTDREAVGVAGLRDGTVHLFGDAHQHYPDLCERLTEAGWRLAHEQDLRRTRRSSDRWVECPDCEGQGGTVALQPARSSASSSPREVEVTCDLCDGMGELHVSELHSPA